MKSNKKKDRALMVWLYREAEVWVGSYTPDDPSLYLFKKKLLKCKQLIDNNFPPSQP